MLYSRFLGHLLRLSPQLLFTRLQPLPFFVEPLAQPLGSFIKRILRSSDPSPKTRSPIVEMLVPLVDLSLSLFQPPDTLLDPQAALVVRPASARLAR
jgi:hypothetical protein